ERRISACCNNSKAAKIFHVDRNTRKRIFRGKVDNYRSAASPAELPPALSPPIRYLDTGENCRSHGCFRCAEATLRHRFLLPLRHQRLDLLHFPWDVLEEVILTILGHHDVVLDADAEV